MTSKVELQPLQWQKAGVLAVEKFRMPCILWNV